jgi:hypothetical protein
MEVHGRKLLDDLVQQVTLFELGNFRLDAEFVENLTGLTREAKY